MSRADQMNMFDLCNQMDLESPKCRACILPGNSYIAEIGFISLSSMIWTHWWVPIVNYLDSKFWRKLDSSNFSMNTLHHRHLNGQFGDEMNDLFTSFIIGQTIINCRGSGKRILLWTAHLTNTFRNSVTEPLLSNLK